MLVTPKPGTQKYITALSEALTVTASRVLERFTPAGVTA